MSPIELEANCVNTAMGILPHTDIDGAMATAPSLDISFGPQLPRVSCYEGLYVKALDRFPGTGIDPLERKILFDLGRLHEELPAYLEESEKPETFRLTETFSLVYHRFLESDLREYRAIRGRMISPISLGLKSVGQDQEPIIYHDEVKEVLFDFIRKKVNLQHQELRVKNAHAFVRLDDPGLGLIFNAPSGYNEVQAKGDLDHPLKSFFGRGGIIFWEVVPTHTELLEEVTLESLTDRLETFWEDLVRKEADKERLLHRSFLAPATCNLLPPDKEKTVEKAFDVLKALSAKIREKYRLN
jgi:hypothetical protein